jgi:outer membrane immunogenic protein
MRKLLFVSAGLLAVATPAAAQDFAGIRIEGRAGYDWVSINADLNDGVQELEANSDEDGFAFGVEGGYDFPLSQNFILGIYGGIDFSDADFCQTYDDTPVVNPLASIDQACLEVKRNFFFGARAGAQVGTSTLIYAKAGYSNGQAEIEVNDVDNVVDDLADSDSRDGWHLGIGLEQNFGTLFYGKLEFVQTFYGDLDFASPDYALSLDGDRSQVVAGLGLRF